MKLTISFISVAKVVLRLVVILSATAVFSASFPAGAGAEDETSAFDNAEAEQFDEIFDDDFYEVQQDDSWVDPIEPVNRAFFYINDKLYFWILKPAAIGYGFIVPRPVRIGVRNVFDNVTMPVRAVNNLLQGKVKNTGIELSRFAINTTIGLVGFFDPALDVFGLEPGEEDLGQTLGSYGIGDSVYIFWPLLGPSNIRDSIGLGGDYFLNPLSYLSFSDPLTGYGLKAVEVVNKRSLDSGEYEKLKKESFDPYVAVRDIYLQYRRNKVTN